MRYHYGWYKCKGLEEEPDDFDWCLEMFGEPTHSRWFYEQSSNLFYFKNEKDAFWFELKFFGKHEVDTTT